MPSSLPNQIFPIIQVMIATNPDSILDVGIGFGKFGVLAREYLEIWQSRYNRADWRVTIDGIEAYEPYITELHKYVYNRILIGDALQMMKNIPDHQYQLVLAIDVLEHFQREQGEEFLKECRRIGAFTLVSTPRYFCEQEAFFGNAYERHQSGWSKEDLTSAGAKDFIESKYNIIAIF